MSKLKRDTLSTQKTLSGIGRRRFISNTALTAFELALGLKMVYGQNFPTGLIPVALSDCPADPVIPGKSDLLTVLNDRPWNAETPVHLLDARLTSNELFFVRNNGLAPERSEVDLSKWKVELTGESIPKSRIYSFNDLQSKFPVVKKHLTLECAGNGRMEFSPGADGNQWSLGAVGCAEFEGIRLKDLLEDAGMSKDAVYIAYEGADRHLSGDPAKKTISRGVPVAKALEEESLIAWNMNGKALPMQNGYPLRLVFGGWPASCSGKWLTKILIRNKIHDGEKMTGSSYRIPCEPIAPGEKASDENMCIIESMPVKSIITFPKTGALVKQGRMLELRGHAWAGDLSVAEMHCSMDFGRSWIPARLENPVNRLAWQHWTCELPLEEKGYYEIWARATDDKAISQPMVVPGWNPKGYLNNACHRIAVKVI